MVRPLCGVLLYRNGIRRLRICPNWRATFTQWAKSLDIRLRVSAFHLGYPSTLKLSQRVMSTCGLNGRKKIKSFPEIPYPQPFLPRLPASRFPVNIHTLTASVSGLHTAGGCLYQTSDFRLQSPRTAETAPDCRIEKTGNINPCSFSLRILVFTTATAS